MLQPMNWFPDLPAALPYDWAFGDVIIQTIYVRVSVMNDIMILLSYKRIAS